MNFEFDPIEHRYMLDGQVIPSVTQLLKPLTNYDSVPEFMLERAAARGTAVHEACHYFITGEGVDEDQYTDEELEYFKGFKDWFYKEGVHIFQLEDPRLVSERPMCHPKLKYGVTPDIIIDGVAIIEIKTRQYDKNIDPLQIMAQEHAWTATTTKICKYDHYVLELRKDGTYKFHKAFHPQAWSRFRFLLDHWHRCKEYESNVAKWRKTT